MTRGISRTGTACQNQLRVGVGWGTLTLFLLMLDGQQAGAQEFPQATISNKAVTAAIYLPDPTRGYYRGTRFDWSGQVSSLKTLGHEYFGQWFPKYDPKLHDSIMGPVEEFAIPLGYDTAPVGGKFVRIGVGVLRKPEEQAFQRFRTYDIVDPGTRTNKVHKDRVEFVHELNDGAGTAYRYTKVLRLVGNKPEMRIEHTLRNLGTKPIKTVQYNHNFFVIDGKPTGPGVVVRLPFTLRAAKPLQDGMAEVRGRELVYLKEIPEGKSAFTELEGFGPTAADFDVEMEHGAAGAGVRMKGDRPIKRIVYWSIRPTFCTEPYIDIAAEPGKETRWTYTYSFYKLPGVTRR